MTTAKMPDFGKRLTACRKSLGTAKRFWEGHTSISKEWIMRVVAEPYERYEVVATDGEHRTILTGRVPESNHWIMVVFVGNPETGLFLTTYRNRGMIKKYGGLPWDIQ